MKKGELVDRLEDFPDDIEVFVNDSEYSYCELQEIWVDKSRTGIYKDRIILSETPEK